MTPSSIGNHSTPMPPPHPVTSGAPSSSDRMYLYRPTKIDTQGLEQGLCVVRFDCVRAAIVSCQGSLRMFAPPSPQFNLLSSQHGVPAGNRRKGSKMAPRKKNFSHYSFWRKKKIEKMQINVPLE